MAMLDAGATRRSNTCPYGLSTTDRCRHDPAPPDDYLRMLAAPLDGMWESTAIASATVWEIYDREQYVGYFCSGDDDTLLRFHLAANSLTQAQAIFHWIVTGFALTQAIASTLEPAYFALCLEMQQSLTVHSYLFRDHHRLDAPHDLTGDVIRQAEQHELDDLTCFYHTNVDGAHDWAATFLRDRLARGELSVWRDQQTIVATGECIPSQRQAPYADIGMVVGQAYRGRGLGSAMLIHLKHQCYAAGWQPICSCAAMNHASKRAIEKAGFISEQRMVHVHLATLIS